MVHDANLALGDQAVKNPRLNDLIASLTSLMLQIKVGTHGRVPMGVYMGLPMGVYPWACTHGCKSLGVGSSCSTHGRKSSCGEVAVGVLMLAQTPSERCYGTACVCTCASQ